MPIFRHLSARGSLGAVPVVIAIVATGGLLGTAGPARSAFPGTNGKIAFERGGNILTVRSDGRGPRVIRNSGGASSPVWSPNGRRFAFEESADGSTGGEKIAIVNADGSGRRKVTDGADPSWSPDGRRIAFEDGNAIFVVAANGTGRRLVVRDADGPAWSPNGNRIAFTRERGSNVDIFTISLGGTDLRRLTAAPGKDDEPAWAPDGRRLVFVSERRGSENIFTMAARGGSVKQLTRFRSGTEGDDPAFSPDGRRIAFERSVGSRDDIFAMRATGARVKRLARGSDPDWQRRR